MSSQGVSIIIPMNFSVISGPLLDSLFWNTSHSSSHTPILDFLESPYLWSWLEKEMLLISFSLFLKVGKLRHRRHRVCYPERQSPWALEVGREPRLPSSGTGQCCLGL